MFLIKVVILIILILLSISKSEIQIENQNYYDDIISFASFIYEREVFYAKTTIVIYTEIDKLVDEFYKKIAFQPIKMNILSVKLDNLTIELNETQSNYRPDLTIAFLQEENTIEEFLFNIEIFPIFFGRSRFLIIYNKFEDEADAWLTDAFNEFWTRQAGRVIICFWKEQWKIYSYNPYFDEFSIEITNRSNLPEIYSDRVRNMNQNKLKLFNFDNIYKYRIEEIQKFGKKSWIGMDGVYISAVAQFVKASLEVFDLSSQFSDGIVNSVDRDIPIRDYFDTLMEIYDFDAICNVAGIFPYMDDMDHVWHMERDDYYVITPISKQIPRYLYIFLSIPVDIWCATILSLITVSGVTYLVRKWSKSGVGAPGAFFDNYGLLVGQSITERDQDIKKRYIILAWCIFCLVFTTLFQSILTTTMVSPLFYPNIDTLEDLFKTDYRVWIVGLIHKLYLSNIEEGKEKILEHFDEVPRSVSFFGFYNTWLDQFLYPRDKGMLVSQEQVYYIKGRSDLFPYFHVMKQSTFPYVRGYYVRPNKFLYPEFVEVYALIEQAGLYVYWKKYNFGIVTKQNRNSTDIKIDEVSDEQVLTVEHLQLAFLLLLLGFVVAFIIFLFEFVVFYCCKRNKKSQFEFSN